MTDAASLSGITVLDLGQIYNGPYATFLMAMSRLSVFGTVIGEACIRRQGAMIFWSMKRLKPGKEEPGECGK